MFVNVEGTSGGDSHGVPVADVLAGSLDDGLAGLVESSVNTVVGSGVGFLDESLELRTDAKTMSLTRPQAGHKYFYYCRKTKFLNLVPHDKKKTEPEEQQRSL